MYKDDMSLELISKYIDLSLDEIQELLDGKINKKDFLKAFEDFLEGNLVQDSVDIISKIGIPAFLVLAGIFAAHYFINKK